MSEIAAPTGGETITNTWMRREAESQATVNDLQPLRHETDSFFDFDCDLESPGSPVDECEYLRLIETASNTPHNSVAESGYVCTSVASSSSSNDATFFDVLNGDEAEPQQQASNAETHCKLNGNATQAVLENGYENGDYIDVQQQIIEELQAQSEQTSHAIANANNTITAAEAAAENAKSNEATQTVVNGHNEVGMQERVQIELTELKISVESVTEPETSELTATEPTERNSEQPEVVLEEQNKRQNIYTHTGLDTTDDEDECRPQRVRRCSSLKTGKTPPGTPGRKKIVRFADKLGLDLADIKTFLDEIPHIPKSAFEDLEINDNEPPIQLGPKADKLLVPLFQQPGGLPTFLDLVRERQVSLENAAVTDHINQTITGSVRVRNLDFNKSVHIRYTLDHWRSFADLQANYVENSCDGFSDKFTFVIFGNSMHIGQRLEFAVRFQCKGQQFWDNNYGTNYCFQCLPATSPLTATHTSLTSTLLQQQQPLSHNGHMHNQLQQLQQNHQHQHQNHSNMHGLGLGLGLGLGHGHCQGQSLVLGLLSPTTSDAWCSSFY